MAGYQPASNAYQKVFQPKPNTTPGYSTTGLGSVTIGNTGKPYGAGSVTMGPSGIQNPSAVAYTLGNTQYNYAGDVVGTTQGGTTSNFGNNDWYQQAMLKNQQDFNAKMLALNTPAQALSYDVTGAKNTARAQAGAELNPYYQKVLDTYLQGEALKKSQKTQLNQWELRDIQDTLTQQTGANETSRTRTAEDTQLARTDTNLKEDQMQTDTGTAFDDARIEQARQLFVQGMTTSGAGARQMGKSQADRNTLEQRASEEFDRTRASQDLFQSRTFEDLNKSDEWANLTATKGTERATFDLASFIANQDNYMKADTLAMEREKQVAIDQAAGNIYTTNLQNWISSIGDTKVRQATRSAYM